jgi:hypothetical protein
VKKDCRKNLWPRKLHKLVVLARKKAQIVRPSKKEDKPNEDKSSKKIMNE